MKGIRDVFSRRPKKYRVGVFRVPEKKRGYEITTKGLPFCAR
jgi:hypothetical protein